MNKGKLLIGFVLFMIFAGQLGAPLGEVGAQEGVEEEGVIKGAGSGPVLVSPVGDTLIQHPTFKWIKVDGATQYQFLLYRGATLLSDHILTKTICSGSYCTYNPGLSYDFVNYNWIVKAYKNGVWVSSSRKYFKICPPQPRTIKPIGDISDASPAFYWYDIGKVDKYLFRLFKSGKLYYFGSFRRSEICPSTVSYCKVKPEVILPYGSYRWDVMGSTCGSTYSPTSESTVFRVNLLTPTSISPNEGITITSPTYRWSLSTGATRYQLQVFRGNIKTIDRTLDNPVCSRDICSVKSETKLAYGAYRWHVRAFNNGNWTSYSDEKSFAVDSPDAGFKSTFMGDTSGWQTIQGSWNPFILGYYKGNLKASNVINSSAYWYTYKDFDYQVKMKRLNNGDEGLMNYLVFRGNPKPTEPVEYYWDKGIFFGYSNTGYFIIRAVNDGKHYDLLGLRKSYSIKKNDWNILRVRAVGSDLKFYINERLVAYGKTPTFLSGRVGFGFYNSWMESDIYLLVDWAKLNTVVSSQDADMNIEMQDVDDVPEIGLEPKGWSDSITPMP